MIKKIKIALALSGGVDSAVAGMLLKRKGYDLSAVYLTLRKNDSHKKQAKSVADFLKIPFYEFNFAREFKQKIIDYFIAEYEEGRTPNPCVKCNRDIKFGLLFEKSMAMGFDKLATGHYVTVKRGKLNYKNSKSYQLCEGKDKEKDQSYFLYNLGQDILAKVLFPVGNYNKAEIKKMAKKWSISVEEKESQDICFLQRGEIHDFLKDNLKSQAGDIITTGGEKIGKHQGLFSYTLGQRRAIGIGGTGPFYVIKKDYKNNILIVSKIANDPMLLKDEFKISSVHWVADEEPPMPLQAKVRIRYRQPKEKAVIEKVKDDFYHIRLKSPQRAVAPGQSVVFYLGRQVLGGGIII